MEPDALFYLQFVGVGMQNCVALTLTTFGCFLYLVLLLPLEQTHVTAEDREFTGREHKQPVLLTLSYLYILSLRHLILILLTPSADPIIWQCIEKQKRKKVHQTFSLSFFCVQHETFSWPFHQVLLSSVNSSQTHRIKYLFIAVVQHTITV